VPQCPIAGDATACENVLDYIVTDCKYIDGHKSKKVTSLK